MNIFHSRTKVRLSVNFLQKNESLCLQSTVGKISNFQDMKKQFKAFSINFAKNQPVKIGLEKIEKLYNGSKW